MTRINGIALNPVEQKQFTDHLAPLAAGLGVPLLFHNEVEAEQIQKLYPGLSAAFLPFEEFNPEWLITNYDVSILSDQWPREDFHKKFVLFELKYGKRMRNIHCPHGFSDKGFYLRGCAFEDICLIYGQNMLDLFEEWGVAQALQDHLLVGNFRRNYFLTHAPFYQELIQQQVLDQFVRKQPIILYAPTCQDQEESSSYFEVAEQLLEQLPHSFNLIVKPHPQLAQVDPARFLALLAKFDKRANVLFLTDFPLIFPLLSISDIYVGDFSSIGYDFLAFNKPMFFLNHKRKAVTGDRSAYLFQCGTIINPSDFNNFFAKIESALPNDDLLFKTKRAEVYQYTYGVDRSFPEIKRQISKILKKD